MLNFCTRAAALSLRDEEYLLARPARRGVYLLHADEQMLCTVIASRPGMLV
jgi:hypothetical protein